MSQLLNRAAEHLLSELPFVIFRSPKTEKISSYFLNTSQLFFVDDCSESGFVFAPFDGKEQAILFPREYSDCLEEVYRSKNIVLEGITTDDLNQRSKHIQLVAKGVSFLKSSSAKKVVLSRKETQNLKSLEPLNVFENLLALYKNAFVYLWFHPKVGLWLGATPETLISVSDNQFKTIALASTQAYKGTMDVSWGDKEVKEHQYVVDFISEELNKLKNTNIVEDFKASETYTVKAGNLLHLKADITGKLYPNQLQRLIKALHPTPAVCGLPKDITKSFILENELYNRSFYTGYLGELNVNEISSLFVNLRCVEIDGEAISFYVGGGITEDSNAEKEWEETVLKTRTIKKAIK